MTESRQSPPLPQRITQTMGGRGGRWRLWVRGPQPRIVIDGHGHVHVNQPTNGRPQPAAYGSTWLLLQQIEQVCPPVCVRHLHGPPADVRCARPIGAPELQPPRTARAAVRHPAELRAAPRRRGTAFPRATDTPGELVARHARCRGGRRINSPATKTCPGGDRGGLAQRLVPDPTTRSRRTRRATSASSTGSRTSSAAPARTLSFEVETEVLTYSAREEVAASRVEPEAHERRPATRK